MKTAVTCLLISFAAGTSALAQERPSAGVRFGVEGGAATLGLATLGVAGGLFTEWAFAREGETHFDEGRFSLGFLALAPVGATAGTIIGGHLIHSGNLAGGAIIGGVLAYPLMLALFFNAEGSRWVQLLAFLLPVLPAVLLFELTGAFRAVGSPPPPRETSPLGGLSFRF